MSRLNTWRAKTIAVFAGLLTVVMLSASSCGDNGDKGQKTESKSQQSNYNKLVSQDPAHSMGYSPTRKTINFWIDTWSKPGKIAYVYLQNANGDLLGFYTLVGPPVSMCTSLTPNYHLRDEGDAGELSVPAPSVDGVYYSGGECNTYYGKDASNGSFIEFTAGLGINLLMYDQPLPNHPNVENLAPGH